MDGTMDGCLPDIVIASQFSHGLSLTIPFRNFLALANAQCARSAKLNSLFLCPFDASLTAFADQVALQFRNAGHDGEHETAHFVGRVTPCVSELKERSCGFISLGDAWCDTTNEMGRFMLTVMSGIAELERDLIRKRCQAGIERAKEKGVKFGRPRALGIGERKKIAERYGQGETMAELARDYDVGEATIHRAIHGR